MTLGLWLAQNLIMTAFCVGAVWIVCRFIPTRPALQHALWAVVLIKFLIPPGVTWPWSLSDVSDTLSLDLRANELLPSGNFASALDASISSSFIDPLHPAAFSSWMALGLVAVWLVGAIVAGFSQWRSIRSQICLLQSVQLPPTCLTQEIDRLARRMGVRPVPAYVAPGIASPFLSCVGRLKMIWPAHLANESKIIRLRGVIAHEMAHLKRHDHWVAWLKLFAGIVWWWNPLFWFVRRQLHETAEIACDALAVDTFPDDRRTYVEALFELSLSVHSAEPAPALTATAGDRGCLERRLTMICSNRAISKMSLGGLLIVGFLAIVALPSCTFEPSENASDTPAASKQPAETVVEFYLAQPQPSADLKKVEVPGRKSGPIYLHKKPVLTNKDITEARLSVDEAGGYAVDIVFNKIGQEKFAKATGENIDKIIAITVDGKVIFAALIRAKIVSPHAKITGTFTEKEAKELVKKINSKDQEIKD